MTALVIRADARQIPLPDASVDLIVTSPPYFGLRSYSDGGIHYAGQIGSEATPAEWLQAMLECTREWMRVLKPTGSIWVNLGDKYDSGTSTPRVSAGDRLGDGRQVSSWNTGSQRVTVGRPKSLLGLPWRYALACMDDLGLTLRAEVIWSKPNGLPESVTDRTRRAHEQWFHFTQQPRYFADIDAVREPHTGTSRPGRGPSRSWTPSTTGAGHRSVATDPSEYNPLGKAPGSVWEIPSEPLSVPAELGVDHYAAFPTEWPRRLIKGWSPVGGLVLDPFGGTGTTALVASALGRHGVTVDRSADYCRIARWRTTDPAQRAKALGVDKPPAELSGQEDIFALLDERNADVG